MHADGRLPPDNHASRATDLAVAQMLDLAKLANVSFQLVDDRLVMHSARMNAKFWPPVRHCLDEIGVDAIADYFRRTTPREREALAAAA